MPLPSRELQALDGKTEEHPELAAREAEERLKAQGGTDALLEAQLYAILAYARGEQSQPDQSDVAADLGIARLGVPSSPDAKRLLLRLKLLRSQMLIARADSAGAVAAIDKLLIGLPDNSLERACSLSVRAMAYDFLNQPDRAVADALVAYRLADTNGWANARMETAFSLARNYRRAGLYAQAQKMLDVVISIGKSQGLTSLLSTAEYERGLLLASARRFPEARAALEQSKIYSALVGDRFSVAAANVSLCSVLINQNDLNAADLICNTGDSDLATGHRADLAASMLGLRARLDLERARPAAALAKLNSVLSPTINDMLPAQAPQLYRDRARASAALGRYPEAYADLTQAHTLDLAADVAQRNRQVAVLGAVTLADELSVANRLLGERVSHQQEDLSRQHTARRLWATSAIAAAVSGSMFAYLLVISRRHNQSLRRHEIILRSAGSRAPDAFLMLDEKRLVRFANRNICGYGPVHAVGQPLGSGIPSNVLPALTAAIDEALLTRNVVNFSAEIPDACGAPRQFEMCVLPALDGEEALGVTLRSIDVTEVRALERGVVDEASLERRRLSSELHEGLGQQLAGVLLLLGNAAQVIKRGRPGADQLIEEIAQYIGQSVEATRELARDLAPVKVGAGSLTVALRSFAEDAASRLHVEVASDCRLEGAALSDLAADHLYTFCREAVSNAALHCRCTKVAIDIHFDPDILTVKITDDGVENARSAHDGFGIRMMAYRARLLGGALRLTANPEGGACANLTVPMSRVGSTSPDNRSTSPS